MHISSSKITILFLLSLFLALSLSACATPSAATWSGIFATEEIAYLSTGSHVYAVDLQTGAELWRYPEKSTASLQFYAAPLLTSDGQLIIGSAGSDNALLSLDAKTGQERWASPFRGAKDHWVATPLEWQGMLYAPNGDGFLYILDLNGNLRTSVELGKRLWSAPVTDGRYLYVAGLDHHLYAFDPQTQQIAWKADLQGSIASHPTVSEGKLFSGSFASRLYAFDLPSGEKRWEAPTKGWIWGTPLAANGNVYVGDLAGQVYAFRGEDGRLLWQKTLSAPVVAGGVAFGEAIIFVSEKGNLQAFDAQGTPLWQRQLEGQFYTPPFATSRLLLLAPMRTSSALIALDQQGNILWTFSPK
ncbi:MAG: PQQ-binding-like beta-propeller repeat protein [Anaerolineales bacterium]